MDYPVTPAVRVLREKRVAFEPHLYEYEERGGTRRSAAELGVEEHAVVKTLVMETESREALVVLMHGDREVSTKQLARHLGVKSVQPCAPETAQKHTGYVVGGTSPFGTRARLPVYVERTIFGLPKIYINGGKRGFLVSIEPRILRDVLPVEEVEVAIGKAVGD
jgi:Cys-tRNA(Pro) deacylase